MLVKKITFGGPRAQGTLSSVDRLIIFHATGGVVVSMRSRDHGPDAGKRVLAVRAPMDMADVQSKIDLAEDMACEIILEGCSSKLCIYIVKNNGREARPLSV